MITPALFTMFIKVAETLAGWARQGIRSSLPALLFLYGFV